jgi:hypothetical protein
MVTPLGTVVRGLVAGAVGTLAMDVVWYIRYRRGGGEQAFTDWEFSVGLDDWSKASAPAQVGKRLYEGLFQTELSHDRAALTSNIMHWGYGLSWGGLFGLLAGSRPRLLAGPPFGALVWSSSYVVLPRTGLYKPIWEYDLSTLWQDLSAHLTYGSATATAYRLLGPSQDCRARSIGW